MPSERAFVLGRALVCRHERRVLAPYRDYPKGLWTIGYGCRFLADGSPVTASTPKLTPGEADDLLDAKLYPLAAEVDAMLPAESPDWVRAALYDFAWNEGAHALSTSTLLRAYRDGDVVRASQEFHNWVTANGIVLRDLQVRREEERNLFVGAGFIDPPSPALAPTTLYTDDPETATEDLNDASLQNALGQ